MSDTKPRIGVFDSGVGGLTVLRHLIQLLPAVDFVYFGDTARVPYGGKSAGTIKRYTRQAMLFLEEHNVEALVVACNTASALALADLHNEPIPIFGMIEGAAHAAFSATRNKTIGVIGTRATIASAAYSTYLHQTFGDSLAVVEQACPLLVPLAEEAMETSHISDLVIGEYLEKMQHLQPDTIILGCTHYPVFLDNFRRLVPNVALIDCGQQAAFQLKTWLGKRANVSDDPGEIEFYVSDLVPNFQPIAERLLGRPVSAPHLVSTEHLEELTHASPV